MFNIPHDCYFLKSSFYNRFLLALRSCKTLLADENGAEVPDSNIFLCLNNHLDLIEINVENDETLMSNFYFYNWNNTILEKFVKYFDKFDNKPREECKLTNSLCTIYGNFNHEPYF